DEFIGATLRGDLENLDLRIFAGEATEEDSLLFDSGKHRSGPSPVPKLKRVVSLPLYGQTWMMEASSRPGFEEAIKNNEAFFVLPGGILVSILTALVSFFLSDNKKKAAARGQANKRLLPTIKEQQTTSFGLAGARLGTESILESITD